MTERPRDDAALPDGTAAHGFVIPDELPILPLRGMTLFPTILTPLAAGQARSLRLIDQVARGNRLIGFVMQRDSEQENAGPGDTHEVGVVGMIHQLVHVPNGTVRLTVQGLERFTLGAFTQTEPFLRARITRWPEERDDALETRALTRAILDLVPRCVPLGATPAEELAAVAAAIDDPLALCYFVVSSVRLDPERFDAAERQRLLALPTVREKLELLRAALVREVEVLEVSKTIQSRVQEEVTQSQREYILREQRKAIDRELGEDNEGGDLARYRERIAAAGLPEEAAREAERELGRLEKIPPASPEYGMVRTYLDWLTDLPWSRSTESTIDVAAARAVLDAEHHGLEKIKERLLEYLAVRKLRQERGIGVEEGGRDPILCFVGPPGVGKTSLAQSIAHALGRELTRLSLGGVRDEAEIRGHRRTYVGALPGRVIQGIKRAGANDPVFVLDEVDKIGNDWRGDPSSALLEVLDPEQNDTFRDHYLDVAFDLSKVMFICTANTLDTIPGPLRDRMEIISLSGYTDAEKREIALRYLVPKQLRANGLRPDEVVWTPEAVGAIIDGYTREAGVRNLEREIGSVCRKAAVALAGGGAATVTVDPARVRADLGRPRHFYEEIATRTAIPGVTTGLVVTSVGGDLTFIEATAMEGRGRVTVTGQLGDVMKESAQAAVSYVRSRARRFGIDPAFFADHDLHIHVPAGAVPKDGPSAGITIATAIVSLLTNTPVREDVAMTGEITLRGQVLPIGGLKEKSLAAHRAGLRTIVFPARNEADVDDLPAELRADLRLVPASTVEEVLAVALPDLILVAPEALPRGPRPPQTLEPAAPVA